MLDACGFGLVLIETVGTGQGEVEIASLADTTVVVQAPEMGDEVQALKAGLLEVADIVAVTKADRPGADHAAAALRAMLTVGAQQDLAMGDRPHPRRPEVLLVSALTGVGVPELLAAIDRRAPQRRRSGELDRRAHPRRGAGPGPGHGSRPGPADRRAPPAPTSTRARGCRRGAPHRP